MCWGTTGRPRTCTSRWHAGSWDQPRYAASAARALNNLGVVYTFGREPAKAREAFGQAEALLQRVVRDHPHAVEHPLGNGLPGWRTCSVSPARRTPQGPTRPGSAGPRRCEFVPSPTIQRAYLAQCSRHAGPDPGRPQPVQGSRPRLGPGRRSGRGAAALSPHRPPADPRPAPGSIAGRGRGRALAASVPKEHGLCGCAWPRPAVRPGPAFNLSLAERQGARSKRYGSGRRPATVPALPVCSRTAIPSSAAPITSTRCGQRVDFQQLLRDVTQPK